MSASSPSLKSSSTCDATGCAGFRMSSSGVPDLTFSRTLSRSCTPTQRVSLYARIAPTGARDRSLGGKLHYSIYD